MKFPFCTPRLEYEPHHVRLISKTLEAEGISCAVTWVQNRDDFVAAITRNSLGLFHSQAAPPALDAEAVAERAAPRPRGAETLLLAEDDPGVRQLACDILQAQGYRVLRASNGEEGLRMARELQGRPIGLVITDVVMPRMGGNRMAESLRASQPDLKVLFTSGYSDDAVIGWGMLQTGAEFLPKPYTLDTLVRKVRAMLDAAPKTTHARFCC